MIIAELVLQSSTAGPLSADYSGKPEGRKVLERGRTLGPNVTVSVFKNKGSMS